MNVSNIDKIHAFVFQIFYRGIPSVLLMQVPNNADVGKYSFVAQGESV